MTAASTTKTRYKLQQVHPDKGPSRSDFKTHDIRASNSFSQGQGRRDSRSLITERQIPDNSQIEHGRRGTGPVVHESQTLKSYATNSKIQQGRRHSGSDIPEGKTIQLSNTNSLSQFGRRSSGSTISDSLTPRSNNAKSLIHGRRGSETALSDNLTPRYNNAKSLIHGRRGSETSISDSLTSRSNNAKSLIHGRRGSGSANSDVQSPKLSNTNPKSQSVKQGRRDSVQLNGNKGVELTAALDFNVAQTPLSKIQQRRRVSDPGPGLGLLQRPSAPQEKTRSKELKARRASDLGILIPGAIKNQTSEQNVSTINHRSSKQTLRGSDVRIDGADPKYKEIHCTVCLRNGERAKGHFYCHDCRVGLCEKCANEHMEKVTINRHSVSVISTSYMTSPNQGPFPNLTQIGSIKIDEEISIRGSAFLPNGVLIVADFTNSKIMMFTGDYTRKMVASLYLRKENKWDERKPKPLDVTEIRNDLFAFTTSTGCIYIVTIGLSMLMKIDRIITVIRFESNYGECHGLAFNAADDSIYVGCTSDREGTCFNVYGLDGVQRRTVRNGITDVPDYLAFGVDKTKLYAADTDTVTVYDVRDFSMAEQYTELQAQTKDILVDKYGYLYTLALERRTFKSPGSIYRLEPNKGVTKVTALNEKPSSMCYCPKTDTVAVTYNLSRNIVLFKLVLRTYEKEYGNEIKPYQKTN